MKVVHQKISAICLFDEEGKISPIRIKLLNSDSEYIVVNIDKVLERKTEKFIGNITHCFLCQCVINNYTKLIEIKYEIASNKWILYKVD